MLSKKILTVPDRDNQGGEGMVMVRRFFVISGCSGGGKSTLLAELRQLGCAVIEEPGRRIVAEQLACGGAALPWVDAEAFSRRAVAMARQDLASARHFAGPVFFDRGLVDASVALGHVTGRDLPTEFDFPYERTVFLAPPWPDIYVRDAERQHGFDDAVDEYDRLYDAYRSLGCTIVDLPKVSVNQRAKLVLDIIGVK